MFGYVTPFKPELKMKDYEKFKAYYCGLCLSIKKNYGNIPRLLINYDMTFIAVLLDALEDKPCDFITARCVVHPLKKRIFITNNLALDYASFLNVALAYYKLADDIKDDKSLKAKLFTLLIKNYVHKFPDTLKSHSDFIKDRLKSLYILEDAEDNVSIDELSHPFAELTAFIVSEYKGNNKEKDSLYNLGYNLGKWIYIIDAFDDLEEDMRDGKFNALCKTLNKDNLDFYQFRASIKDRIDFLLVTSARNCFDNLNKLSLRTNNDILYNILQDGLLGKMKSVFDKAYSKNK
ncbi:hypothetical protein SAMN02745134_01978 [Clostridium acidisoli DSM 12555]|uniref:Uncharacterized protein n=1 Tax=Clostridium acidisoli DSM 12555 TaxID=1121291 RepID=A0A1W1XIF7_9CLOT|nr:DUF5685 family protein [Clostridium acidisoli]SMC23763.1 hypothetical protein SAMN02745134_01978 [Clostridium acidisoli DSM 12555]